jgi:3D (Asp-Asp-Asp) domain-containing protein
MDIRLKLFKILAILSLFSLNLLVVRYAGELTFPSPEANFSLSKKSILETSGYFIIQSNSLLPVSNPFLDDSVGSSKGEEVIFTITAYYLVPWETDDDPCILASGINACEIKNKKIVACPRKYPFGTKFLINGEIWECQDRLNIKYDDRIDLLVATEEEMEKWGKRILPVTIFH